MDKNKEEGVYVTALQDSLKSKCGILERVLQLTKEQEELLSKEELDMDAFDEILETKGRLIEQMEELDQGFESVYARIKVALEEKKQEYKPYILEMQDIVRRNTDLGVKIQALEQNNKQKFEWAVMKKKQEIQGFRVNNRSTGAYTQHMANQHQQGESYFFNKKK